MDLEHLLACFCGILELLPYTTRDHLPSVGIVYTETLIKFPTNLPTGQCDKLITLIAVSPLKIAQAFVKLPKKKSNKHS